MDIKTIDRCVQVISVTAERATVFFGVFYSCYNSARLIGDTLGLTILPVLGHFYFYLMMTAATFFCS
jgi:uncharacterized membrane protein (DUF106 family)